MVCTFFSLAQGAFFIHPFSGSMLVDVWIGWMFTVFSQRFRVLRYIPRSWPPWSCHSQWQGIQTTLCFQDDHESDLGSDHGNGNDISDRIHGTGIFAYIYHTNQLNVGKYTKHGSYGLIEEVDFIRCPCFPQASMYPFGRLESATTGVGCDVPYFWKSLHDPLLWRLGGLRSSHKINFLRGDAASQFSCDHQNF